MKKVLMGLLSLASIAVFAQKPVTIDGAFKREKFKPAEVKLFKVVEGTPTVIATSKPNKEGKFGFQFFPDYEGFYVVGTGADNNSMGNYKFWLKPGDRLSVQLNDSSYSLTGALNSKENLALTKWFNFTWPLEWKSVYFSRNMSTYVDFFPALEKALPKVQPLMAAISNTGNRKFDAEMKRIAPLDLAFFAVNFLLTPRTAHPDKEELPAYYSSISVNKFFSKTTDVYQYPWGKRAFSAILLRSLLSSGEKMQGGAAGTAMAFKYIQNDTLKGDYALTQARGFRDYGQYLTYIESVKDYIVTDSQKEQEFQLNAGLATLKPGDKGFEFKFEDKDGKMVAFSDLKGKVVLVDTWATWCGPCKVEIPHLKKLEEEMKGKNVAIVSISVDEEKDKEKWKKMIADENLGGIQLFAKGWSEITKYYKITGIPRFLVFDKEGKIVTVDAPRPSSPDLKPLLEKYM